MKKWLILGLLIVVGLFVVFGLRFFGRGFVSGEVLVGNFTPSSREFVLGRLDALGCSGGLGYVEGSSVCFVCEPDVCFDVAVVDRGVEGMKWNVVGLPRFKGLSVRVVDAVFDGVASRLGCGYDWLASKVDCDGSYFVLVDGRVRWFLKPGYGLRDVASVVCPGVECFDYFCDCGGFVLSLNNSEVLFGRRVG